MLIDFWRIGRRRHRP